MQKILLLPIVFACSIFFISNPSQAQSIGTFNSLPPAGQSPSLVLPSSHTFQRIIRTGDALTSGGNFGGQPDFTGYVPIAGSSTNGYLSISSETVPAECAILSLSFNTNNKLWSVSSSGKVAFPLTDIGYVMAFCSGTVTPKNTIMVCEEVTTNIDGNNDGYEDLGWIIEIDPATRTVINQDASGGVDKLWAMGRQKHENVTIKSDQSVAYWGADDETYGYVYKFIPTVAGNFSAGTLYVLETTGLGGGTWKQVNNTTQAERNNTVAASTAAGAFNFNRVEDMEIGPDGKIYFSSTATGTVYRFEDNGATINNLEPFVEHTIYNIDVEGSAVPVQFEWPDNLAFDGDGNLWILQDGGENHIWVVAPSHTTATPAIRIFANTPLGSEATGITFSPDYKFMFLSIQHPNGANNSTQPDASGANVTFDTPSTLVIARTENLGNGSILPLRFVNLQVQQKSNGIAINWATAGTPENERFFVERSSDGIHFMQISALGSSAVSPFGGNYLDEHLPSSAIAYYRIRACNMNGSCIYSEIRSVSMPGNKISLKLYPLPVHENLHVTFNAKDGKEVIIKVFTHDAKEIYSAKRKVYSGQNDLVIPVQTFVNGMYIVTLYYDGKSETRSFNKQ